MAAAALRLLAIVLAVAVASVVQADDYKDLTHIKLYFHDVVSGPSPTAVQVARAAVTNTSETLFGLVVVIDDPLTAGPELNSTAVGRAQGMYVSAGKDEATILMNMNFVFTSGRYNGSSVAIMGPNAVFNPVREMSIVGGTGLFRLARGYVEARTHTFNQVTATPPSSITSSSSTTSVY